MALHLFPSPLGPSLYVNSSYITITTTGNACLKSPRLNIVTRLQRLGVESFSTITELLGAEEWRKKCHSKI